MAQLMFPPLVFLARSGVAAQLRAFIDHLVGTRVAVPLYLYGAWQGVDGDEGVRAALVTVFLEVARGGSLRRVFCLLQPGITALRCAV